jgi:CopG family nickel-responsive transcriptional regulator
MERFTISLEGALAREFDQLIRRRGYRNRSEAVRDVLRNRIEADRMKRDDAPYCVGCLSYVYSHHKHDLAERLTELQHEHHDIVVAATHAHLDHDQCLETLILRGATRDVRAFADALIAQRGVRHGQLNLVPADPGTGRARHVHARPKS